MTYEIKVRELARGEILRFKGVQEYSVDGSMIFFDDNKGKRRGFSTKDVEIEEEG